MAGKSLDAMRIKCKTGNVSPAMSHFGSGILTFHVTCIFRTDPGVDLFVTGPVNRPKDAIAPLTGIIETDWSPYTFTMNWQFTRAAQRIYFEAGEPFCHVFPVARREIESLEPRIAKLSENPQLESEHKAWSTSRNAFNASLSKPELRRGAGEVAEDLFQGEISLRPGRARRPPQQTSDGSVQAEVRTTSLALEVL